MNRHTIIGNLTRDPDFKMTTSSTSLLRFSVACSESYKDKNGEWQKKTEFINCQMWGANAEKYSRLLSKGMKVFAEGESQTREYEKNGVKMKATSINVRTLEVLQSPSKDNNEPKLDNPFGFDTSENFMPRFENEEIPF
jgi:single-strand DNA-binding protein